MLIFGCRYSLLYVFDNLDVLEVDLVPEPAEGGQGSLGKRYSWRSRACIRPFRDLDFAGVQRAPTRPTFHEPGGDSRRGQSSGANLQVVPKPASSRPVTGRYHRPMDTRVLGKTGYEISEVGFGAWAIGGSWGDVAEDDAVAAVHAALDAGVTFIDTADVYGDGRSERIIAEVLDKRSTEDIVVATKAGRRLDPHVAEGYTIENIEGFIDRSRANLRTDTLDLVQLHCPPTEVFYHPELFDNLDALVSAGKIRYYGVSVEKVEEAIKAIEYPGVATVQIIFNAFRMRPASLFFDLAAQSEVGVIARVPLASGLLTGKMTAGSTFASDDHRNFNRHGEAFDVGETFSGVPYEIGLEAVDQLSELVPEQATMAQWALRWILMHPEVSVVIPGAKNPHQATSNAAAADLPPLPEADMERVEHVYADLIAPHVHQRW